MIHLKQYSHYTDQIASGQIMRILGKTSEQDAQWLSQLNPRYLQAAEPKEIALFFSKLGDEESIAYARRHSGWFKTLATNPLMPILLKRPGDQLANIPADLLQEASPADLALFFLKLGDEGGIDYAQRYIEWFKTLTVNPLMSVLLTLPNEKLADISVDLLPTMNTAEICYFFEQRNNYRAATYIQNYVTWFNSQYQNISYDVADPWTAQDIEPRRLLLEIIIKQALAAPHSPPISHAGILGNLLICAIEYEDKYMARLLLQREEIGLKQIQYGHRENPLFLALRKNQTELVTLLLARHPLADYQDPGRYNVLYHPVAHKNFEILRELLIAGADPDEKNVLMRDLFNTRVATKTTILEQAVLSKDSRMVKILLAYQAKDDSANALMLAIEQGNIEMVRALVTLERPPPSNPDQSNIYHRAIACAQRAPNSPAVISILQREKHNLTWPNNLPDHATSNLFRYRVFSIAELDEPAVISGQFYKDIQSSLARLNDPLISDSEQIETAFILKNQIQSYIRRYPNSKRNPDFLTLNYQIDKVLFISDEQKSVNKGILDIAQTQPALAADVYQMIFNESLYVRPILMDFIIRGMKKNYYFMVTQGISGALPDENNLGFGVIFHIPLTEKFKDFETALSMAQEKRLLKKIAVDRVKRWIHVGYTVKELYALNFHQKEATQAIVPLLLALHSDHNHYNDEHKVFDKYANKEYVRKQQKAGLLRIKQTYHSIYHTNIAAWDKQYSFESRLQLNQLLHQQTSVKGRFALLLEGRQGLLMNLQFGLLDRHDLIIPQIDTLKELGVTTLALPLLGITQPFIDDYQRTRQMPMYLQMMLHHAGLERLFIAACEKGMNVIALGKRTSAWNTMYKKSMVNNLAEEKLKSVPKGEKFIVVADDTLFLSNPGRGRFLPGIAHRLGLPVVGIDEQNRFYIRADDLSQRGVYDNVGDAYHQGLSDHHSHSAWRNNDVDGWSRATVNLVSNHTNTRFDGQLILQLEDDVEVRDAAAKLAGKHPNKSVFVQLDSEGNYRVIYGSLRWLTGNLRWQVVGHGRGGENHINHQTLAGYNPASLAKKITQLSTQLHANYGIHAVPSYVSLVGCSLTDESGQTGGYAKEFGILLAKQGIYADIGARRTRLTVNELGQKLTPQGAGAWQDKIGDDKLVFSWNKDGQLVSARNLAARLERAVVLIDKLAAGEVKYVALDDQQRRDLTDSFHVTEHSSGTLAEKVLDVKQLMLTVFDSKYHQWWRHQVDQLLQLQGIHSQLRELSGQVARQQSQHWNTSQASSLAAWQNAGIKNLTSGVEIQTHLSPQGLFISNKSARAQAAAAGLGLIWLHAHMLGTTETQRFFQGVVTHALINEQRAKGSLSDVNSRQIDAFRHKFNQLASIDLNNQAIFTRLQAHASDHDGGEYLLKTDHHVLMLSSRYQGRQHSYFLYDPAVGELRVSGPDVVKNREVLNTVLQNYLAGKIYPLDNQTRAEYYGVKQQRGQYLFETYKINIAQARTTYPALTALQVLLSDFRHPPQSLHTPQLHHQSKRLDRAFNFVLNTFTLAPRILESMRVTHGWQRAIKFSHRAGIGMQGYGYLRGLYDLKRYDERVNNSALIQQEIATQPVDLEFERNFAMASFASNIAIDVTQYGLGKLGGYLANRMVPGSRLGQIGVSAGSKLARFGGPILGGLSSGFDIFQAQRLFRAQADILDPKIRQDFIVSGSLSVVGAAISIGSAIAFALGGTAAAVAVPVSLIIGAGMILGSEIYGAVRQIEEIQHHVSLDFMETLSNGWRVFTGEGLDNRVQNRISFSQAKKLARQEYDRLLREQSRKILLSNRNIDVLYTTRGQIKLQQHYYRKIVAKDLAGREHTIRDHILASENAKAMVAPSLSEYLLQHAHNQYPPKLGPPSVTDSDYLYYTPEQLVGTDDTVDDSGHLSHQVLKARVANQYQTVGQFTDPRGKKLRVQINNHNPIYYNIGDHSVMGDFNGDGWRDIGYFSLQGFYLLLADKKGGYGQAQRIGQIEEIESIYQDAAKNPIKPRLFVRDINHDGRDDIVIKAGKLKPIHILLAQENNGFIIKKPKMSFPSLWQLRAITVLADIDGDLRADLVSFIDDHISIHYGGTDGEFTSEISVPVSRLNGRLGHDYIHHLSGDIDGDGCDDIVSITREGQLHILLGKNDSFLWEPFKKISKQSHHSVQKLLANFGRQRVQLHDMNTDGYADLVVIQNDGSYTISYGGEEGVFRAEIDDTWRQENGQTVAYRPNRLAAGEQHILGLNTGKDGQAVLLSLNKQGDVNAHTFSSTRIKDTIAWFRLGDGNDSAIGHQHQINHFDVAAGRKQFTGGHQADRFLLMGKAAPDQPSVLNGGTALQDQGDAVIAAAQLVGTEGYNINLDVGYAKYRHSKKIIAELHNIEHAYGHSGTNDILVGDNGNNVLDGMGGIDTLIGNDGNDILTLQAGMASGGRGIDSYHILQNNSDRNVTIVVEETQNLPEVSNILLDYKAEQITSITLHKQDVWIRLRNDEGRLTTVVLRAMYSSVENKQRKRQHIYHLSSRDGLLITEWPAIMEHSSDGGGRLPHLTAQYKPERDRNWQERIQGARAENVQVHLTARNRWGQGQININIVGHASTINTPVIALPSFIQLDMVGTKFVNYLEGDDNSNYLWSTHGKDLLVGKGGTDHYMTGLGNREITIDNYDNGASSGGEPAEDILLLPWLFKDIRLTQKGKDIVLSHRNAPALHSSIRLLNFMQHRDYRHLWLQDENRVLQPLIRNDLGAVSLGQVQVTSGDDVVMVYHETVLTVNKLNLLAGDDIFIARSMGGYTVEGGEGDDVIVIETGNNILIGGKGKDTMVAGNENDIYQYARGDGQDIITDSGGHDRLYFSDPDITKEDIRLKRQGNDLVVLIDGLDSTSSLSDSVTIKNHYSLSERGLLEYKIEIITVGAFQLAISSIDDLLIDNMVEAMSNFPFSEQAVFDMGLTQASFSTTDFPIADRENRQASQV
ncbi:hypothetical protein CCS41_06955 [Candidatus Fukatsuia symbiotica]|uniref:Peptidase C80 domain-containing protein n=2 Tax=Yersiniaceae TaxID=1903411 RepID=A0A2U8I562_9GAMM|nr:C80 family cysteine peptidase [Candidatus Fukatsuia symbiotica]AWK14269.1 hypothetical protein CCS41_06955 [Candidatus Fukatsuia symbiotica]